MPSITIYKGHKHDTELQMVQTAPSHTWIAGFDVSSKEILRPSNASLQVPSVRVFSSPLDFPNALVCILEEAVSRGYTVINEICLVIKLRSLIWNLVYHTIHNKMRKMNIGSNIEYRHLWFISRSIVNSGWLTNNCSRLSIKNYQFFIPEMH